MATALPSSSSSCDSRATGALIGSAGSKEWKSRILTVCANGRLKISLAHIYVLLYERASIAK